MSPNAQQAAATLVAKQYGAPCGRLEAIAWCRQCEGLHWRGLNGPENKGRGERCASASGSAFLVTGFGFAVAGEARSEIEVMPACGMRAALSWGAAAYDDCPRLWQKLKASPSAARLEILRLLFGRGRTFGGEFTAWILGGGVSFNLSTEAYQVTTPSGIIAGVGLLSLARDVFGVSEGIAGRRLLELLGSFSIPGATAGARGGDRGRNRRGRDMRSSGKKKGAARANEPDPLLLLTASPDSENLKPAQAVNVADVDRAARAQLGAVLAQIAPRGRCRFGRLIARVNPNAPARSRAKLKLNRFTGQWLDEATGAAGSGPVSLLAYAADVSEGVSALALSRILDLEIEAEP